MLFGHKASMRDCFNTQPPEGGCDDNIEAWAREAVSTHSRPKAAASVSDAAPWGLLVSTHSRPKAAAPSDYLPCGNWLFQHTAARRRLRHSRQFHANP